jgi:hypothetical protein
MEIVLETDYRTGLDLVSVIRDAYDKASEALATVKATSNDAFMVQEYELEMARWETLYATTVSALELGKPFQITCAEFWARVNARVVADLASI